MDLSTTWSRAHSHLHSIARGPRSRTHLTRGNELTGVRTLRLRLTGLTVVLSLHTHVSYLYLCVNLL